MDKKLKEEMAKELEKLGIKKDETDDYMVWGVKKLMLGVMKIKWSLEENGVTGKEADNKLKSIVDKVMAMSSDELHQMMHKNGEDDWSK